MSSVEKTPAAEKSDKIKIIENVDDVIVNTTVDVNESAAIATTAAMNEEMARKMAQRERVARQLAQVKAAKEADEKDPKELPDIEDMGNKRPPSCCK